MITPEYLNEVIAGTEEAVGRLNTAILIDVAKHIVEVFYTRKGDILMPSTIQELYQIVQSGYSLNDIQKLIENAIPSVQKEIRKAFYDSASLIASYNDEFARQMVENGKLNVDLPEYIVEGIPASAKDLHMTKREILCLENAYRRTNGTVKNLTKSTAKSAFKSYIQACDDAYMKAQAGVNLQKAVDDAVKDMAARGCTAVVYQSGHSDRIDVAIARAVRTGINQANSEIMLTRASEMGVQYVKVSQHLGARVTDTDDYTNHEWWQGKIYSLDWNQDILQKNMASVPLQDKEFGYLQQIKQELMKQKKFKYPDFVETCGYGDILGIIGINCRHTFQMWNPEYNVDNNEPIDEKENEKRYKAEQTQRAIERKIRRLKGEREALKQLPPNPTNIQMRADLTKKINYAVEQYQRHCKKYGLAYYSERLGVGVV